MRCRSRRHRPTALTLVLSHPAADSQAVMTALCSKSDEPALAQKVFDEGVKKLLLENPASSNERHLHPKRPVKDQARFIRCARLGSTHATLAHGRRRFGA